MTIYTRFTTLLIEYNIFCLFFCMLATYKLKQIMWCTTISVQYFTAQVPEKISKLKAEVKLTRRSCFNK